MFGKHTLPEIELEGVSKRNIVFLGHTKILLEESVCAWMSGQCDPTGKSVGRM